MPYGAFFYAASLSGIRHIPSVTWDSTATNAKRLTLILTGRAVIYDSQSPDDGNGHCPFSGLIVNL